MADYQNCFLDQTNKWLHAAVKINALKIGNHFLGLVINTNMY